ncbi:class I adenylate-forming enzyme family protein [Pseudonocardia sp. RS010]|uniref:class I adenylate-forming enzyme family protein n=1 Tax=Pseudonocardia sp. RS010 TaxID=3385979 RepID=UPI00399F3A57
MNGIDYLDRGWRLAPDRACLVDATTGARYTYAEVRERTFRIANGLRAEGFGVGSVVGVLAGNDPDAFVCVLGAMRAGATYLSVNARNSVRENAEMYRDFGCDVLFVQGEFVARVDEIRALAPNVKRIVRLDGAGPDVPDLAEYIAGVSAAPFDLPHDHERPYEYLTTGGTTGRPKVVVWPNRQMESVVANFSAVAPCDVPPVFLAAAPLTHLAGKFMQYVMAHGGTGIVMPRVDRQEILRLIPHYGVTHLFLPPTVIYDLLDEPGVRGVDYSSLRYFLYSAAPMAPARVRQAIETFGPVMCQVWGQSESAWNTVLLPRDHLVDGAIADDGRLASCGRPLPFVQVEVMDEAGNLLGPGEHGELVVRGMCVMTGYLDEPELTASVSAYGWHHTGDIGFADPDGFLHIVDRKKDMIISGGFNVFSAEVERVLLEHPAVAECAVIGVPHEKWGETILAVVEPRTGRAPAPEELIAFCRDRIGGMKAPKAVEFVEALPRNANGKILKQRLRDRFWVGTDRNVS